MEFRAEEAIMILGRTPDLLKTMLDGLPEDWTHASEGPGTFSPYEVVGHLLHGERTDWLPRLEIVLEEGEARPFEPFDRFAHRRWGRRRPLSALLEELGHLRAENVDRLEGLLEVGLDLDAAGRHPELGRVTVRELLAAWVVHDLGHVRQIARVMAKQYGDQVGPWRTYLPVLGE